MQLIEYRKLRGLTRLQIAGELQTTENTVYRWETGKQMPRREDLKRIKEWSNGAVTADDFVELGEERE